MTKPLDHVWLPSIGASTPVSEASTFYYFQVLFSGQCRLECLAFGGTLFSNGFLCMLNAVKLENQRLRTFPTPTLTFPTPTEASTNAQNAAGSFVTIMVTTKRDADNLKLK